MGLLMLKLFLETYDLIPEDIMKSDFSDVIFIASVNKKVSHYAHEIAQNLRNEDFPCIIDYRFENLGNQLRKASEIGVRISLILGPKEMEQNKITIKNMVSEQQKTIDAEDLINEIFSIFDKLEEVE